jgi:hypothetical protein
MRAYSLVLALVIGTAVCASAQDLAPPATLNEAQDDMNYAELLNAARLTPEQLVELLSAQTVIATDGALRPDEAAALAEVRLGVLRGLSAEEASRALGDRQQIAGQARQRFEQLVQAESRNVMDSLTDEQRSAMAWAGTPARALDNVVAVVSQTRKAPGEQWQMIRGQLTAGVSGLSSQTDPAAKVTPDQIVALLDAAHAMDDQTFAARQSALPREWAQTILPSIVQRLANQQLRDQQVNSVVRQLITYRRGQLLVKAKQKAGAAH